MQFENKLQMEINNLGSSARMRKGQKWTYLVSLSITTNTTDFNEIGNPSIKSILTSNQGLSGMGRGYNNPVGKQVSCLSF